MKRMRILAMVAVLVAAPAMAQEKPTAAEARKVMNYYFDGNEGAILLAHSLCLKMGAEKGPDKNNCVETVAPESIQKGQKATLWMNYLIPQNTKAEILISFSRNGKVRRTETVGLSGATRYRTWVKLPTDKVGQWSVSVTQELDNTDLGLADFTYSVAAPQQ